MATTYAWSPIHLHETDEEGKSKGMKVIQPGEEVTKEQLGSDDSHWKELINGGAVRYTKYPEGLDPRNPNSLSPNEHRLRELRLRREELEREIAGVGGSAHVLANTEPSDEGQGSEELYERDPDTGEFMTDGEGHKIPKAELAKSDDAGPLSSVSELQNQNDTLPEGQ